MLHTLNAENPSRAIAYVRVSSQRQVDEGVSIEAQIKRIREYARYKGMEIDDKDIIIEEGVSGGVPIWERPGGRHLRTRLETGSYPHILTMRLDRMFRLVTDALATVDELADSGISLHACFSRLRTNLIHFLFFLGVFIFYFDTEYCNCDQRNSSNATCNDKFR